MKHLFRFHGRRLGEASWQLFEDEWHHILKVLRLSVGDRIEIADGEGWVGSVVLESLQKSKGDFAVESEVFTPKCLPADELTIGLGVLKPQGIDEVLPGLVELGVHRLILVPFLGMDKSRLGDKLLDRWQRQIVAASKQAKTPWFPELVIAKSLDEFLVSSRGYASRFLLDPAGEVLPLTRASAPGPVLSVVGSEGGWSEGEVTKFSAAGFERLAIRSNILRATTAVLATAAIFRQSLSASDVQ
ncbi:MAG: 16S rRNA (uracil(1498)-N(3))-methyltransferase [Proteobacteria bacterium]|nr:MAG: 16S rRNA (uracil(1498)-N(3))-methyltransferase [Pseudomonadota bacterium]